LKISDSPFSNYQIVKLPFSNFQITKLSNYQITIFKILITSKPVMKRTALLIAAIIYSVTALAQNVDYIIKNNGDTVKCNIKVPLFGKNKYKLLNGPDNQYLKLEKDSVKEYYLSKGNIIYRRVIISNSGLLFPYQKVFLQVIENGQVSLYIQQTTRSTYSPTNPGTIDPMTEDWYVSKNSDTAKIVKPTDLGLFMRTKGQARNDFTAMLEDNPAVFEKFVRDDRFSFATVQNIIHLYNTGEELPKKPFPEYPGH